MGIPEGEEKGKPTEFVTSLIPKLLGQANFQKPTITDHAQRLGGGILQQGHPGPAH